ncbi:MAG: hypothetical protein LBS90_03325 [Oscillospiraceae bacterium]|jgi:nitrogen regulatory protein PII|nr:hypothetical protein [Oscillospiraceae bacterium]
MINADNVPKLLAVIIPLSDSARFEELLNEKNARHTVLVNALGTASSEFIDVLGLSGTEKTLFVCAVAKPNVPPLLTAVTERFELRKPGRGIAFVLPASAMNAVLAESVAAGAGETVNGGEYTMSEERFELILAIIKQGYSDKLMNAARGAGARGGTVFHARGTASVGDEKFHGISVQPEKEIVSIIAPKAIRRAIMDALSESCGAGTEAAGVFVSVPIEQCVGISG